MGLEAGGIPPFAKSAKDPDFLYAAPPMVTCAAFIEESRLKFVDPTKPTRKSGDGALGGPSLR